MTGRAWDSIPRTRELKASCRWLYSRALSAGEIGGDYMEKVQTVTWTCVCSTCGNSFTLESSTGPSRMCDACALPLLEILWGCRLQVNRFNVVEPVRGRKR